MYSLTPIIMVMGASFQLQMQQQSYGESFAWVGMSENFKDLWMPLWKSIICFICQSQTNPQNTGNSTNEWLEPHLSNVWPANYGRTSHSGRGQFQISIIHGYFMAWWEQWRLGLATAIEHHRLSSLSLNSVTLA